MSDNDNFASELLAELKTTTKKLWTALFVTLALWMATGIIFIWYIYNTENYTVEATGIYTAVDRSGNIVTQDVDPETWQMFMEWLEKVNGEDESDGKTAP